MEAKLTGSLTLQELLAIVANKTGCNPKQSGNCHIALCAAHGDKHSSLSIREAENGIPYCIASQDAPSKTYAQHLESKPKTCSPQRKGEHSMADKKTTEYCYKDENNNTLFKKIRTEPGTDGKSKSFYCEHEENGQTIKNLEGCRKILYRLPELLYGISARTTRISGRRRKRYRQSLAASQIASTAPVTNKWHDEYTDTLKDADVVILYDNDKAGLQRRDLIARNLYGKVKKLRVVDLPGIDISRITW